MEWIHVHVIVGLVSGVGDPVFCVLWVLVDGLFIRNEILDILSVDVCLSGTSSTKEFTTCHVHLLDIA